MISAKKILLIILVLCLCTVKSYAVIKDSLFATVGNKAITKFDIIREIKIILITRNQPFSEENRSQLETAAIKSVVKRNIKKIEIEKYDSLKFNRADLDKEINRLASISNLDVENFKNIFESNGIDFSNIIEQIKVELLWNSLIFELYKNRLSINTKEIEEELKIIQNEEVEEYLISEIIIEAVPEEDLKSKINDIKNEIKIKGFEQVAMNLGISESASRGGDLGWISERVLSENLKPKIINTRVGEISDPVILPVGIVLFKIRDKRKIKKDISLEQIKKQLLNAEKSKILNMHSLSHYDKLRRSISIKYY